MKKIIILPILLLFFTVIFHNKAYSDWQLVGYVEDKDSLIVTAFLAKPDSLKIKENNIRSIWSHVHTRLAIPLDKFVTDIAAIYEFNCYDETFRTTETVLFYADGTQEKNNTEKEWNKLTKKSTRMLFDFVCKQ